MNMTLRAAIVKCSVAAAVVLVAPALAVAQPCLKSVVGKMSDFKCEGGGDLGLNGRQCFTRYVVESQTVGEEDQAREGCRVAPPGTNRTATCTPRNILLLGSKYPSICTNEGFFKVTIYGNVLREGSDKEVVIDERVFLVRNGVPGRLQPVLEQGPEWDGWIEMTADLQRVWGIGYANLDDMSADFVQAGQGKALEGGGRGKLISGSGK